MKTLLKQKRNLWLLAWPVGIAVYLAARTSRQAAEQVFARGIFRGYSWLMSHLTGWIPFSVAEILLIVVPLLFLAWLIVGIVRVIGSPMWSVRLVRLVRGILIITGVIYCWYMIGCGTNYHRYEFAEYSGLKIQKSTKEELYGLCRKLAFETNEARKAAVSRSVEAGMMEPDGVFVSYLSDREMSEAGAKAMTELSGDYEVLRGYYPLAKPVHFSRFMSRFNITGVYFPWTVEANVNVDVPDYTIGATVCHELSHLRGFMREDEANFIGYLASVRSSEPELVYSGYMHALVNATNRLYSEDKELYYEVRVLYDDGIVKDMIAHNEYWTEFEDTVASKVGEQVNDTYLKANSQTDGTKSYGRMVDLLLAEYRAAR